jgi:hypothetical protein
MVESIAIMEYLMGCYGPTPLVPDPHDPAFPAYQQFLHLGEAGLAASMYFVVVSRNLAPVRRSGRKLCTYSYSVGLWRQFLAEDGTPNDCSRKTRAVGSNGRTWPLGALLIQDRVNAAAA